MEKLRKLRKEKGISLKELGATIGVAESTMSLYENGKRQPDYETLLKFAKYFNVSVDYFIGDSISFDFSPHDIYDGWDDNGSIKCPICDEKDGVHFIKSIPVDFENEKSDGVAIEFRCAYGHKFYYVIETYKGMTYIVITNGSTIIKTMDIPEYESNPQNLAQLWNSEKYNGLDDYGKDVVNIVLEKELTRTIEQRERSANIIELNFIDAPVSAGIGDMLEDYENSEKVFVPLPSESRIAYFILKIYGDSMEPKFSDGDYILVRQQPMVDEGQIGIFGYDGNGYIKKFGGDRLISLNKKYPDIYIDENARCFGLVLGTTYIVE